MNPSIDLKTILDLHRKWLRDDEGGERANLQDADLRGADLQGADLRDANLQGANLQGANLRDAYLQRANLQGADLQGANLHGAHLRGANLQGADLRGANLQDAYLQRANLQGAHLRGANLQDAYLQRANLQGANLQGAKYADLALAMTSHLPEGDLIGWKKCRGGVIVKLQIPMRAKRSHGASRKCRAEFAKVLEVIGAKVGISEHDGKTEYRVGKIVRPDGWNEDRWEICGQGIHFYITRLEAENN